MSLRAKATVVPTRYVQYDPSGGPSKNGMVEDPEGPFVRYKDFRELVRVFQCFAEEGMDGPEDVEKVICAYVNDPKEAGHIRRLMEEDEL